MDENIQKTTPAPAQPADAAPKHEAPLRKPVWAQLLSDVCSPIMVPTYAAALAMWVTPLRTVSENYRILITVFVFVITGLVPFLTIALLIKFGKVSDRAVSDRRQRALPMSIAAACYVGAALFVGSLGAPMWFRMFFYGGAVATVIDLIITFWWKISAHTTSMGGLVGMMFWFAVTGMADVNKMIMLSVGIILAGAMATARLLLKRHTLGQVLAGLSLGFACIFGMMCIG